MSAVRDTGTTLPYLRLTQSILALITLALLAHLAALLNSRSSTISTPSSLNFALFVSIYSLLIVLPYTTFAPKWFPRLANRHTMLIAEVTSGLGWFGAFVATANWISRGRGLLRVAVDERAHARGVAVAGTVFGSFEL
jgi:hypothetical protein